MRVFSLRGVIGLVFAAVIYLANIANAANAPSLSEVLEFIPSNENLFINGDFEFGVLGAEPFYPAWKAPQGLAPDLAHTPPPPQIVSDPTQGNCLKMEMLAGDQAWLHFKLIQREAGTQYRLSYRARADRSGIRMQPSLSGKTFGSYAASPSSSLTTNWRTYTKTWDASLAPSEALSLVAYARTDTNLPFTIWVDDLSFVKESVPGNPPPKRKYLLFQKRGMAHIFTERTIPFRGGRDLCKTEMLMFGSICVMSVRNGKFFYKNWKPFIFHRERFTQELIRFPIPTTVFIRY